MGRFSIAAGTLLAFTAMTAPAQAASNLIVNGGFQDFSGSGNFTTLQAVDDTSLPGWEVVSGSIDVITGYWQGANGTPNSIDLSGNSNGTLAQTISTVVGQVYRLVFFKSANPDGDGANRTIKLSINGTPTNNFTYVDTGQTNSNMNWQKTGTLFKATGTSTTLAFAATSADSGPAGPGHYGFALDGVSVTATPEPEAYASMAVGLGLAGFLARRRQRKMKKVAAAA